MIFSEHTQPKSFRVRALIFLAPVVILEALVAVFLADYVARKGLNDRIGASLSDDARLRSISVLRALDDVEASVRRLAIHPGIRRSLAGRDRLTTFLLLNENVKSFPPGTRIIVTDKYGARAGEAAYITGKGISRPPIESGIPVVTQEQILARESGIVYILPIQSGPGVVGNLTVEVPWSHIGVGLNQGGPRDYVLVADGKVRIASRRSYESDWDMVPKASSRTAPVVYLGSDLAVRNSFRNGDVEFEVLSVALASEIEVPLASLQRDLTLAFGFLSLAILAVTVYLTSLLSRPLADIDRQVREMARSGIQAKKIAESGTAETTSLARSFNDFLSQIQKTKDNEGRLLQQLAIREKMAALGTLAGGVAHEFNNALGGIVSNVESALHDVSSESAREDLELVRKVALRASAIAKNLLGFARQAPEAEKTPGDIVEVLEDTLNVVKQIFVADGIGIVKSFSPVPVLKFDRGQMQQVFLNLLTNARQAMKRGDTLKVSVSVMTADDRARSAVRPFAAALPAQKQAAVRTVEIVFTDTGVGIPEGNLSKIFEPFFTTKGALGGAETPGTGLGLSVSHTIVRNHGGDLAVSSRSGAGTTVAVVLPVDESVASTAAPRAAPLPAKKTRSSALKILVVDDEDSIRSSLAKTLRRSNHDVDAAPNGHSAVRMVESEHYDMMFLDLLMPDMDGFGVFEQIKKTAGSSRMPFVVFMTGAPTPQNLERASSLGALGIMEKPFLSESVTAFIDRALSAIQSSPSQT